MQKSVQGAGTGEVKCNLGKPSGPGVLGRPPAGLDFGGFAGLVFWV